MAPKEGLFGFWKWCFYLKSADTYNGPRPVQNLTAEELAILPHYYVMSLELGIHDTLAQDMTEEEIEKMHEKSSRWFSDAETDISENEFGRTGFQGGLSWCHVTMNPDLQRKVDIFAGKKIEVPLSYILERRIDLVYQHPDSIERKACTDFRGVKWVEDAGHWAQQEQLETVIEQTLRFLDKMSESPTVLNQ